MTPATTTRKKAQCLPIAVLGVVAILVCMGFITPASAQTVTIRANVAATAMSAQFTSDFTEGMAPLTVHFTDITPGRPTTWLWDFGDGTTSVEQNPTHTYTASGLYTVALTVTSVPGVSTKTEVQNYIGAWASTHTLVFNTPGLTGTTDITFDGSVFEAFGGTWSLVGNVLTLNYPPGSDFKQLVITLSPFSQSGNIITGHVISATLETKDLAGSLISGTEQHTIIFYLNAVPPKGSLVETDTIDHIDPQNMAAFEALAAQNDMILVNTYYEMFVSTTIPESTISSMGIKMMVPPGWYNPYSDIRIIGVDPEGNAAILSTGSPTLEGDFVIFNAPSFSGYNTFGIAILKNSPPPVDNSGSGNDVAPVAPGAEQPLEQNVIVAPAPAPAPVPAPELQQEKEQPAQPPASKQDIQQLAPLQEGELASQPGETGEAGDLSLNLQSFVGLISTATGSENVTLPLSAVIPDKYAPVAAVAVGVAVSLIGTLAGGISILSQLWDMIMGLFKKYLISHAVKVLNVSEIKKRGLRPLANSSAILFGISLREILVMIISALIFAAAFILQDHLQLKLTTVIIFVCVAGIATILRDLAQKVCAHRCGCITDYQIWGLGTVTMLSTAWLFGNAFAKPSRTLIRSEKPHSPEQAALIKLAGPVMSMVVAIVSLFLIPLGGLFVVAGSAGFTMNLLYCVFSLVPFRPNEGADVYAWSKPVWAAIFIPLIAFYLYIYILL